MSEEKNYWGDFKDFVAENFLDYGDSTPIVLAFGLASKVAEVFEISQKEIMYQKSLPQERINTLKKVFTYIASIEVLYEFPSSPYTSFLGTNSSDQGSVANLLDTHAEALSCAASISTAITDFDTKSIQAGINNIILTMIDVCHAQDVDTRECITTSIPKKATKKKETKELSVITDKFKKAFSDSKASIRKEGKKQATFDLLIGGDNLYKGIKLRVDGKQKKFYTNNIVVDFFTASNYLYNEFKELNYRINYTPSFRMILHADPDALYMGYLIGDRIVTATEMIKDIVSDSTGGTTVKLGKKGRPVLLTPAITDLDYLLEVVNKVRSGVSK